jgi:ferrous iron transport protein B
LIAKKIHIAIVGNPNIGKSSLFNYLTGLNQKVGNFPGVTVEKKTGNCTIADGIEALIIDLPGTYSLYPKREDEWVAYNVMMGMDKNLNPDIILLMADASNLKRNLLFTSQIIDLKRPVIVALTMTDIAAQKGIKIDVPGLERELGVPIVPINPRKGKGIVQLKQVIKQTAQSRYQLPARDFINNHALAPQPVSDVLGLMPQLSDYAAIHYLINHEYFEAKQALDHEISQKIEAVESTHQFNHTRVQAEEIMQRYARIKHIMQQTVIEADPLKKTLFTDKLDKILLHRFWGYAILLAVLFLLFHSIFWIAQYPMDAVEWGFARLSDLLAQVLPGGWFTDLTINGIVAGLSGILVFVPQIAILFGLITLLEDTGYMARISFLSDRLMRRVGMNGKSVMPIISGMACAVPAIMSARSIENKKERLLTIMVAPLMSCSARLPVYTILVGLIIPKKFFLGFIGLQGLVMMGLYLLGFVMALIVSWVMKHLVNIKEKSIFLLELPLYKAPRWRNMFTTMWARSLVFVRDAGKVIMVISLILWALSSYGPRDRMHAVSEKYEKLVEQYPSFRQDYEREKKAALLENSYAGIMGRAIEPAISPLGFDWKIGIALITSFAAREVFVGTMATLYSVGDDSNQSSATLRQKMAAATRPDGKKIYTLASGLSLLVFYVLAMQCMSTLAVVRRETRSWKWPLIQLVYMTVLAYTMSWLVYTLFSL